MAILRSDAFGGGTGPRGPARIRGAAPSPRRPRSRHWQSTAAQPRPPPASDSASPRTGRECVRTDRFCRGGYWRSCRALAAPDRPAGRMRAQSPDAPGRPRAMAAGSRCSRAPALTEIPASSGSPRAGRDQIEVERPRQRLACADRVIAPHGHVGAQGQQIIDQGEGEAVVIVERQYPRRGHQSTLPPPPMIRLRVAAIACSWRLVPSSTCNARANWSAYSPDTVS